MLLLTLRGTPTIYYGDELAIGQVEIPADRVQDPFEKNVPGIGVGRDGARTPMQWSAESFAGFSTVEPWLPLAPDWRTNNVAAMMQDPTSILSLHRKLLVARRSNVALSQGRIREVQASGAILSYRREHEGDAFMIVLNFSGADAMFERDDFSGGTVLVSTSADCDGQPSGRSILVRANEGLLIACAIQRG